MIIGYFWKHYYITLITEGLTTEQQWWYFWPATASEAEAGHTEHVTRLVPDSNWDSVSFVPAPGDLLARDLVC
jgi:hypothetical protein